MSRRSERQSLNLIAPTRVSVCERERDGGAGLAQPTRVTRCETADLLLNRCSTFGVAIDIRDRLNQD